MNLLNSIIRLILILILTSCYSNVKLDNWPDPFAEAYWDRKVKMIVAYDVKNPSLTDTTYFDHQGNIVEQKGFWYHERTDFNSLRFLVRKLRRDEGITNYHITYRFDSDKNLLQTWNSLNHFNWDFDPTINASQDKFVIKLELDKTTGKVLKQTDDYHGYFTLFKYDETNGSLISKEKYSQIDSLLMEKWDYRYSQVNLQEIEFRIRNEVMMHYFYSSDGLLSHSLYQDSILIKYTHEFFE